MTKCIVRKHRDWPVHLYLQRESWVPAETQWHGTYQSCWSFKLSYWEWESLFSPASWAGCWEWHHPVQRFWLRKYKWALARKEEELTVNSPNVFPGPTLLWDSTGPCTLPLTRKLRASRDAVTQNLPKLLLVIVIQAFLLWLLATAGRATDAWDKYNEKKEPAGTARDTEPTKVVPAGLVVEEGRTNIF